MYINRTGEDTVISKVTITCGHTELHRHNPSEITGWSEQGQPIYATYHSVDVLYNSIGPLEPTMSSPISYDKDNDVFYMQCFSMEQGSYKVETDSSYKFEIEYKGNTDWKELVNLSIAGGYESYNWRTKLKTNAGKTDLSFSLSNGAKGQVFINGTRYPDFDQWFTNLGAFNANVWYNDASGGGQQTVRTYSQQGTNTQTYYVPVSSGTATVEADMWSLPDIEETITYDTGAVMKWEFGGRKIKMTYTEPTDYYQNYTMFQNSCVCDKSICDYKYSVQTDTLPDINYNDLEFTADGTTWNGLVSPVIKNQPVYYQITNSFSARGNIVSKTVTPQPDRTSSQYDRWEKRRTLPTNIGNVTLNNPEIINDYTQGESDWDEEGEQEQVRNNIFKIIPELSNTKNTISMTLKPKTLIKKTDWQLTNCEKRTVNGKEVICGVATDSEGTEYITGVPANAKIKVSQMAHPPYNDESGEPPWQCRQRHWTKCRYIQFNCQYSEPLQPILENGVFLRYEGTFDFMLLESPLKLKYHAYGDQEEKEWKIKRTGCLKWNSSSPHYDVAVYDMYKTAEQRDTADSYFDFSMCEDYKIYDEELEIVYRQEKPSTSNVFGVNIAGSVEMDLTEGKVYSLGDLTPFIGHEYEQKEFEYMARDEFQEPVYVGDHFPHSEGEEDQNHPNYLCNYLTFCINGKRAFQIPQAKKDQAPNYQVDTWDFYTLQNLKGTDGNRVIYPRDDLGEIQFILEEYEPENVQIKTAQGQVITVQAYDINALFTQFAPVFFIKSFDKTETGFTVEIEPRVDTLSGDYLSHYLNSISDEGVAELKVKGQYGAFAQGIVARQKTHITDNSEYSNGKEIQYQYQDHYFSNGHGSDFSIELYNDMERSIEKAVDGVKYNHTHYKGYGKVLKNRQEKILKNSRDKINVGGEYGH